MPDLGKYADTVLSAYAISILLILALVLISVLRSKKINAQLQSVENKAKKNV